MGCPWSGVIYRSPRLKYTRRSALLSGKGSFEHGGRWNTPGSFAAVYGSLTPDTALKEALATAAYYGLQNHTLFPRGIVAVKVKLHNLFDLTSGIIRKHLLISQNRMLNADWRMEQHKGREALSQAVGRAAYRLGFEALAVPSKADPSGTNLVIFPDNLQTNSQITYLNEAELPE